mgnify:CR=1 FL=1
MEKILSDDQKANLLSLIETHTQIKHFDRLNLQKIGSLRKNHIVNILLSMIEDKKITLDRLRSWLSLHQLDGNNHNFVFELKNSPFNKAFFEALSAEKETEDILKFNETNLLNSRLVNFQHDTSQKRAIFTYISPAEVIKRVPMESSGTQSILSKQIYFANIIIDYGYNVVIISINPTANLVSVDGTEKSRGTGFEPIANFYLNKIKEVVGSFHIKVPEWLPNALYLFAEDATYHHNDKISTELNKAIPKIEAMVNNLLDEFGLTDQSAISYVNEEFQQAFENVLIDKYGVAQDYKKNNYAVFEQKGDQVDAIISVGCKTTNSDLTIGRAAKVAKATRSNSDITSLGIEYMLDDVFYRVYVDSGKDYYLIRNKTMKFTGEVVIRNVVKQLTQYKNKIQSGSSYLCE